MQFGYLRKNKQDPLANAFCYLINEESIKQPSLRTRLSEHKNRKVTTVRAFTELANKDDILKKLINDLKNYPKIIRDISKSLSLEQIEPPKNEKIFDFLKQLLKSVNDFSLKGEIYNACITQDPDKAIDILLSKKNNEISKMYLNKCDKRIPEKAFIALALHNRKFRNKSLNQEKLINEIFETQRLSKDGILGKVCKNMHKKYKSSFLNRLNNLVKNEDFKAMFIIGKNKHFFNNLYDNKVKTNIESIVEIVPLIREKNKQKVENTLTIYYRKHNMNFILYILENLISIDRDESNLLINSTLTVVSKNFSSFKNHELNNLLNFIFEHFQDMKTEIQQKMANIINKLGESTYIDKTVQILERTESKVTITKPLLRFIKRQIKDTNEFLSLSKVRRGFWENINITKLDTALMVFSLEKFNFGGKISILNNIFKLCPKSGKKVLKKIEQFCKRKFISEKEFSRIFLLKNFKPTSKEFKRKCKQFKTNKKRNFFNILRIYEPDSFMEEIKGEILSAINLNKLDAIKDIFQELDVYEDDFKSEISKFTLKELLKKQNFDSILKLWDNLSLGITDKVNYSDAIRTELMQNQNLITKKTIQLLVEKNLDRLDMLDNLSSKNHKEMLLETWFSMGKSGNIIDSIKFYMINDIRNTDDFNRIREIILKYRLNDKKLITLLKLQMYKIIEFELINLNYNQPNLDVQLRSILDRLIEFQLEERLLSDKFLLNEIDPVVGKILINEILKLSSSEKIMDYFFEKILMNYEDGQDSEACNQIDILLPHIASTEKRIEWLLTKLESLADKERPSLLFLEISLRHIKKNKKIINQYETEKKNSDIDLLLDISNKIKTPLAYIESLSLTLDSIPDNKRFILINNIKDLRNNLSKAGIEPVESVENLGKEVVFDNNKHKSNLAKNGPCRVTTLGIKVNEEIISYSNIINIESERAK